MNRIWVTLAVMVALTLTGLAQDSSKLELFGGYSFARTEGGVNLHGWNAAFGGKVSNHFGIVGDVSGHYGSIDDLLFDASVNVHTFLVGPQVSGASEAPVSPFFRGLVGLTRASAGIDFFGVNISENATGLVLGAGGGIDVRAGRNLAIRVIQADYLNIRIEGEHSNNVRLSAGVVARF